jgi:hypothetical protein
MHENADLQALADAIESVSARYAERFGIRRDLDWCLLKLTDRLSDAAYHATEDGAAPGMP